MISNIGGTTARISYDVPDSTQVDAAVRAIIARSASLGRAANDAAFFAVQAEFHEFGVNKLGSCKAWALIVRVAPGAASLFDLNRGSCEHTPIHFD